jgi:uncharacterized membrane protein
MYLILRKLFFKEITGGMIGLYHFLNIVILIILIIIILRAYNNIKFRTGNEMTIYKGFANNCGISSYALVPIIPKIKN